MPLALVTGARELLGPAGAALGRAGFDVVAGETPPPPAGPFDCYVQLPGDRRRGAELVARIDALAAVAGRLKPQASIVLGLEEGAGPGTDLLAAVALALLEDLGRPASRLAVVPVVDLCRPSEPLPVATLQWEMPTPPLVPAP